MQQNYKPAEISLWFPQIRKGAAVFCELVSAQEDILNPLGLGSVGTHVAQPSSLLIPVPCLFLATASTQRCQQLNKGPSRSSRYCRHLLH